MKPSCIRHVYSDRAMKTDPTFDRQTDIKSVSHVDPYHVKYRSHIYLTFDLAIGRIGKLN
jgi:hypothetical protein